MKDSHFKTPRSQRDGHFNLSDDPVEHHEIKRTTFENVVLILVLAVLTVSLFALVIGTMP